jgi:hypothetical protein
MVWLLAGLGAPLRASAAKNVESAVMCVCSVKAMLVT